MIYIYTFYIYTLLIYIYTHYIYMCVFCLQSACELHIIVSLGEPKWCTIPAWEALNPSAPLWLCCFFVSGTSNIGLQTRDHYEHVTICIIFIAPFWRKKKVIIHIIFLYILIPWSFNITLIYRLYITWPIYSWWRPTKMGDFPPAEPPGLGRILHLCKPLLRKPGRPWWVPRLSVAINPSSPS